MFICSFIYIFIHLLFLCVQGWEEDGPVSLYVRKSIRNVMSCTMLRDQEKNKDDWHHRKHTGKKWRWAENIARMKDNRWTKRCTEWQPRRGKRSRERPSRRWQDDITRREPPGTGKQQRTMKVTDGGLRPAVDGQSLGERERWNACLRLFGIFVYVAFRMQGAKSVLCLRINKSSYILKLPSYKRVAEETEF